MCGNRGPKVYFIGIKIIASAIIKQQSHPKFVCGDKVPKDLDHYPLHESWFVANVHATATLISYKVQKDKPKRSLHVLTNFKATL